MKRIDIKIFVISVFIIAVACSIGAGSVSAISVEGEDILSTLVAVGSSVGIDINGVLDNFVSTTIIDFEEDLAIDNITRDDLQYLVDELGIGSDVLIVTDLVAYLNRGGSFADWVYDNYGDKITIPDSIKTMSNKDLAIYLMNLVLYPDQTHASAVTTTKYIYDQGGNGSVSPTWKNENETTTEVQNPENEDKDDSGYIYKMGDVDGDDKVTAMDARLALRVSASLDFLEGAAFEAADVNGDGRITANDARSILRYAARITNGF